MCFDNRQLVKGAEYRFHSEEMVEEGEKKKKKTALRNLSLMKQRSLAEAKS